MAKSEREYRLYEGWNGEPTSQWQYCGTPTVPGVYRDRNGDHQPPEPRWIVRATSAREACALVHRSASNDSGPQSPWVSEECDGKMSIRKEWVNPRAKIFFDFGETRTAESSQGLAAPSQPSKEKGEYKEWVNPRAKIFCDFGETPRDDRTPSGSQE